MKTPTRVAKSLQFLTSGMGGDAAHVIGDAFFAETSDELVLVRDITVHSLCEHHMLPFHGKVHVAYVPDGRVVGLSKLARLSELFSRRLQVQERLTQQIADALMAELAPRGVAVVMECAHMCMAMRGVQKPGATTVTSCMLGTFKVDPHLRAELFQQLALPVAGSFSPAGAHAASGGCSCGTCLDAEDVRSAGRHLVGGGGFVVGGGGVGRRLPHQQLNTFASSGSSGGSRGSTSDQAFSRPSAAAQDDDDDDVVTISLGKEDMKFSAGHFTVFGGANRERLHGHNFSVSAEVSFAPKSASDGLMVDYGVLKRQLRQLCAAWDEALLLPARNPHLRVEHGSSSTNASGEVVRVVFGERAASRPAGSAMLAGDEAFELPLQDVIVLPVTNVTGEELSRLLLEQFLKVCAADLNAAGATDVEVTVSSGLGQGVTTRRTLRPGWHSGSLLPPFNRTAGGAPQRAFSSVRAARPRLVSNSSLFSSVASRSEGPGGAGAAGTAVVTGGSSGIGLAVANKFASLGWHVHNIR
jgi:GTP cyclohydrolase I